MSREIEIWADWREPGAPMRMGHLRATPSRGKEVFSFAYDQAWLDAGHSQQLDPDLRFFSGPQYLSATDRPNFGIFLDSSPDRWGRLLMQRREAAQAREEGRSGHRLQETDYLLGVHDEQRAGALRFKEPARSHAWQCDEPRMRTPPWASLRELEHASWKIQDDSANDDPHYLEWLQLLMAPGSSIGGARPKAGVKDPSGDLWIAKFPGRSDTRDMAAWEMLVHQLAVKAGLQVSESSLYQFGNDHRSFLTRRFDRVPGTKGRERIPQSQHLRNGQRVEFRFGIGGCSILPPQTAGCGNHPATGQAYREILAKPCESAWHPADGTGSHGYGVRTIERKSGIGKFDIKAVTLYDKISG